MLAYDTGQWAADPSGYAYQGYQIIRRGGAVVGFEPNRISAALMHAFLSLSARVQPCIASVCASGDGSIELSYAEWQKLMARLGRRLAGIWTLSMPLRTSSLRRSTGRRARAFFCSQKVNGRNAP